MTHASLYIWHHTLKAFRVCWSAWPFIDPCELMPELEELFEEFFAAEPVDPPPPDDDVVELLLLLLFELAVELLECCCSSVLTDELCCHISSKLFVLAAALLLVELVLSVDLWEWSVFISNFTLAVVCGGPPLAAAFWAAAAAEIAVCGGNLYPEIQSMIPCCCCCWCGIEKGLTGIWLLPTVHGAKNGEFDLPVEMPSDG